MCCHICKGMEKINVPPKMSASFSFNVWSNGFTLSDDLSAAQCCVSEVSAFWSLVCTGRSCSCSCKIQRSKERETEESKGDLGLYHEERGDSTSQRRWRAGEASGTDIKPICIVDVTDIFNDEVNKENYKNEVLRFAFKIGHPLILFIAWKSSWMLVRSSHWFDIDFYRLFNFRLFSWWMSWAKLKRMPWYEFKGSLVASFTPKLLKFSEIWDLNSGVNFDRFAKILLWLWSTKENKYLALLFHIKYTVLLCFPSSMEIEPAFKNFLKRWREWADVLL